ncbi:hypothetical protein [Streptomyces massasporeus]
MLATIQATTTGPRRAKAMGLYGATLDGVMLTGLLSLRQPRTVT